MQTEEIRSIWLADPPVMDWACQTGRVLFLITECEWDSLSLNIEDIKLLWTIRKRTFIKFMFYDFPLSFCVLFPFIFSFSSSPPPLCGSQCESHIELYCHTLRKHALLQILEWFSSNVWCFHWMTKHNSLVA